MSQLTTPDSLPRRAPASAGRPIRRAIDPAFAAGLTRKWFALWAILIAGLAIGGRGFAYIGLPPLFISEVTLLLGFAALLVQPRWREMLAQPTSILIVMLLMWGLLQTVPYLGKYRIDAIRDFMLLGYGVTALIVTAVVMSQPRLLCWLVGKYRGFGKVFLLVMPWLWMIDRTFSEAIPTWPWASHVPMINLKPGDMPVHLGAIAALSVVGLSRWRSLLWPVLIGGLLAVTGAVSRGGLVAFGVAFTVAWCFRPQSRWARRFVIVMALAITAAAVTDVSVQMDDRDREFSARQLLLNVISVVDSDDVGDLDDTKTWRLDWWAKIADYTLYGDYFWTGKGFGINLATDDGFQVNEQESLRSPHNGHMNILARAGVPGLALWIGVQLAWLAMIGNAYLLARHRRDNQWSAFFVLLLAYWTALMFNAAVDVYFEGPMGGVWYWSIIGLGIGSVWVYRKHGGFSLLDLPDTSSASASTATAEAPPAEPKL
ncbi:MAG: O-antigen ligase family protein [Planctomycetota bacterium]